MKETGIIRNVDKLGRIVLPRELRRGFNMEPGTPVEIFVADNGIFLQKHESTCVFCGSSEALIFHKEHFVCSKCREILAKTD